MGKRSGPGHGFVMMGQRFRFHSASALPLTQVVALSRRRSEVPRFRPFPSGVRTWPGSPSFAQVVSAHSSGLIRIQGLRCIGLFEACHRVVRIHFASPHVRITAIATKGPITRPFPIRYVILTLHAPRSGSCGRGGRGGCWSGRRRRARRFQPRCRRHMAHR